MQRSQQLFIAFVLIYCFGAIASATSSAEITKGATCANEGIPTLCLEIGGELIEALGVETYTGKSEGSALLEIASISTDVVCKQDNTTGEIVQEEPLVKAVFSRKGVLTFSECSIPAEASCKVTQPIVTNFLMGTVFDEMPVQFGLVKPEAGGLIAEVVITGCLKAAKLPISGEDLGLAADSETYLASHVGEANSVGSELKDGLKAAVLFVTQRVELSGANKGKNWAVVLG